MRKSVAKDKQSTTSTISIFTKKQPARGFGLESSHVMPKEAPEQQAVKNKKPSGFDLNRISMRPQAKLTVNQPGDAYEQEADRVAQQVVQRMNNPQEQQKVQRQEKPKQEEEEKEEKVQAKSDSTIQRQEKPQQEEEEKEEKVQTKSLLNSITPIVQRQEKPKEEEEEEKVQAKSDSTIQRQEKPKQEEEEEQKVQAKSDSTIQRQEKPQQEEEEEQKVQAKSDSTIQRQEKPKQEEEEEEKVQAKSDSTIQRQEKPKQEEEEEEEKVQAKSASTIQRQEKPKQEEEEEQKVQAKSDSTIQRQEKPKQEEEEEEKVQAKSDSTIQRQEKPKQEEEEEEKVQAKSDSTIQRQEKPKQEEEEKEEKVQTKSLLNSITPIVQRQEKPKEEEEEEEKVQAKSDSTIQRQEKPKQEEEEEEKVQAKSDSTIQRQEKPKQEEEEEEEKVQAKSDSTIQRQEKPKQEEEEEEKVQAKSDSTIQREEKPQQEEEEEEQKVQAKSDSTVQRQEKPKQEEEEEEKVQAKSLVQRKSGGDGVAAGADVESSIGEARGGGQPMADNVRQPMEEAIGADFSGVKIHTDSRSDDLNKSVQAKAFTTGQDIFFRKGEYSPESDGGKELLAHELTHVVQQNGGGGGVQQKSASSEAGEISNLQTKASSSSSSKKKEEEKDKNKGQDNNKDKDSSPPQAEQDKQEESEQKAEAKTETKNKEEESKGASEQSPGAGKTNGDENGAGNTAKAQGGGAGNTPPVEGGAGAAGGAAGGEQAAGGAPSGAAGGEQDAVGAGGGAPGGEQAAAGAPGGAPGGEQAAAGGAGGAPGGEQAAAGAPGGAPGGEQAAAGGAGGAPGGEQAAAGAPGGAPGGEQAAAGAAGGAPGGEQAAAGAAGGAAGGDTAPTSAEEDPEFQEVTQATEEVAEQQQEHQPATEKADEAQAAAEPPDNEVQSKAEGKQVEKMEEADTPEFDAGALKEQLKQRIAEIAPKNMEETEEFKDSNKVDEIKGEVTNKVDEEKQSSQADLKEKKDEAPDTSGIEPKKVEAIPETDKNKKAKDTQAKKAAPKPKGKSEVEAPLQEESKSLDKKLADNKITEEQLKKSNEPDFQKALDSKQEAQTHAEEAPANYRQSEQEIISGAQETAVATANEKTQEMQDIRAKEFSAVEKQQEGTKGKDEKARSKVASDINKIYEKTKTKVDKTLEELDTKVKEEFDAGAEKAKQAFEDHVDKKMKEYKDDRYSGFWGPGKWLVDKLFGMPDEVNAFYEEGRDIFIEKMDGVIDKVVKIMSKGLSKAKKQIKDGKQKVQNYVEQLPEDLKQVGEEAAQEIEGKFGELEQNVNSKKDELISTLASKYQENLQAVDARIEEMKEANKGLIQKAIEFIGDVISFVTEMFDLLMKILAKIVEVIWDILADPVGFFKNFIQGIKQGFENFINNIGQHLQQGFIGWLTGTMGGTAIEMPESLDAKGIFSIAAQVLGFTPEAIEERAAERMGVDESSEQETGDKSSGGKATKIQKKEQPGAAKDDSASSQSTGDESSMGAEAAEAGFDIFEVLSTEGVAGLWPYAQEKIGDIKSMVLDQIQSYLIESVVKAGAELIFSMLTPATGFIKACKALYEVVKFVIDNAQEIADLINAILDGIKAIASGAIDQAAKLIEDALAKAIPLAIDFFASLLGLGGLADKVQGVIENARAPIDKGINSVIDKAAGGAKKAGNKIEDSKLGQKAGGAVESAKEMADIDSGGAGNSSGAGSNKVGSDKKTTKSTSGSDTSSSSKGAPTGTQETDNKNKPKTTGKQGSGNSKFSNSKEAAKGKQDSNKKDKSFKEKVKEKKDAIVEWWKARKKFKGEDGETHTIFFKGKNKSAKLMVASTPKTMGEFLEKLQLEYNIKNNTKEKNLFNNIEKAAKEIDDIKKTGKLNQKNKDSIDDNFNVIAKNLTEFYKIAEKLDGTKTGRDKSLPKTNVSFSKQKTQTIPTTQGRNVQSIDGMEMLAEPLSLKPGNTQGSEPSSKGSSPLWNEVSQRGGYVRGHLLNHHVHGPGDDVKNLTPITGNSNGQMEREVETHVKKLVLGQKKVISYKVTVEYGGHGKRNHIPAEEFLPTKIKFEIKQMNKKPGKSGENANDWQINPNQGKVPNYTEELDHTLPNDDPIGAEATINLEQASQDDIEQAIEVPSRKRKRDIADEIEQEANKHPKRHVTIKFLRKIKDLKRKGLDKLKKTFS